MAAAWFKGVQRRICLDYNNTVNKLFHKCFTNSTSIANHSHHGHVRTRASDWTLFNVALLNRHGATARRGEGKQ